jgi:signal transduction histidine kinase
VPYHSIEDPAKLRRVLEAVLLLEADLDLPTLLRHVVDEATSMTNARYGALGVLSKDGTELEEFITAGMSPEEEAHIGARPTGRGVLGLLISDPRPIRMAKLAAHESSFGFPPGHPPMRSFLGVPIKVRNEVYGNLYLTDKIGLSEFTIDDEALIGALAVAAGIAIDNARLHARVQVVAVYEERDRLARDLHDTVIQRLFAIGLSLQGMVAAPSAEPNSERLIKAIADVDDTIRQIRTTIFELGSDAADEGTRAQVIALLRQLRPVVGFDIHVSFDGPVDTTITGGVRDNLLNVVREAVTNIGRHAKASAGAVHVGVSGGRCHLRITDNGCGFSLDDKEGAGLGLGNLRRRAEKLGGEFTIEQPSAGGSELIWDVPLSR